VRSCVEAVMVSRVGVCADCPRGGFLVLFDIVSVRGLSDELVVHQGGVMSAERLGPVGNPLRDVYERSIRFM
jgi:hypothetical protein